MLQLRAYARLGLHAHTLDGEHERRLAGAVDAHDQGYFATTFVA
jgi:hypothetical protein